MRISRTVWIRVFQAILSVSLLYYLVQLIEWNSVRMLFESGVIHEMWSGPVVLLIGLSLAAERWRMILQFFRVKISRFDAFYFYLTGTSYGVALPGVIGGDVVRIAMCQSRTGAATTAILTTVIIERGFGLFGVAIIGAIGALAISSSLGHEVGNYVLFISPAVVAGVLLVLLVTLLGASHLGHFGSVAGYSTKVGAIVRQFVVLMKSFPISLALKTLLLSTAFQASEIWIFYYFGSLLQIDVPISFYLFVVPLVYLSTVLPISLGGVGVREGVLVWLFAMIGTPASDAVLLAFLVYLNRIVVAVLGGCVHFTMVFVKGRGTSPFKEKKNTQ